MTPPGAFLPERRFSAMARRMTLSRPHPATSARGNDAKTTNTAGRMCSTGITPRQGAIGAPTCGRAAKLLFSREKAPRRGVPPVGTYYPPGAENR